MGGGIKTGKQKREAVINILIEREKNGRKEIKWERKIVKERG